MNQRGQIQVLILAGIVILIAVAGGIFFLGRVTAPKPQSQNVATSSPQPSPTLSPTTTTDPTANWKTYVNNNYNFSFKYPADWIAQKPGSGIEFGIWSPGAKSHPGLGGLGSGMEVRVIIQSNTTNKEYLNLPPLAKQDSSFLPIELAGKAIAYRRSEYDQVAVQIGLNRATLYFHCFYRLDVDPENTGTPCANLLDQILSTFRFTQ